MQEAEEAAMSNGKTKAAKASSSVSGAAAANAAAKVGVGVVCNGECVQGFSIAHALALKPPMLLICLVLVPVEPDTCMGDMLMN